MVSKTGNVNQGIPHFQVGDVNFKVEGGDPAKPVCKTKCILLSLSHFHF